MAEFLSRLDGVIPQRDGWKALCPAHDDHRQSLSVKAGHKQPIVVTCHAGCTRESVLTALSLTFSDISSDNGPRPRPVRRRPAAPVQTLVAAYDYRNRDGHVVYQAVRYDPKDFRQRRPDGQGGWIWNMDGVERVPYRLDEIALWCSLGTTTVIVTEGEKDADALWDLGIPATTNVAGVAGGWKDTDTAALVAVGVTTVIVIPDNDDPGRAHAGRTVASLRAGGLAVHVLTLSGLDVKGDVSDFLRLYGAEALRKALAAIVRTTTLADVHAVFRRWLGNDYEMSVLDIVLSATAVHYLDGEPCWLMLVSGPGAAKTETVQALEGAGRHMISTISSVGGLLSGTARRDRAQDATGGLLRRIGSNAMLLIKDFTSMLSLNKNTRGEILAAFREIHDGRWTRDIGAEGGRQLTWQGRLSVIAASTSSWDHAHDTVAQMGDRFLIVRFDSWYGRQQAAEQALANNGLEGPMRRELADVVGRLIETADRAKIVTLSEEDRDLLYHVANLATLARTAVERDYRLDVVEGNMPEMPTRFLKQLFQIVRGAMSLGIDKAHAVELALRCARDSIPPLRLEILRDVLEHPKTRVSDVQRRLHKPLNTVQRYLDALMTQRLVIVHGDDEDRRTYEVKSEIIPGLTAIPRNYGSEEPSW
jgi:hypothetical protein